VLNTQVNASLIESRRTFTDVDMMVPSNLVGIVIHNIHCIIIIWTSSRLIDKTDDIQLKRLFL